MGKPDSSSSIKPYPGTIRIRDATRSDAAEICAIYGYHVVHGTGSFEEVAPSVDEIRRRFDNVRARRLPWLVAEANRTIVGFCYVSPYHRRSAHRFTVQSSIYVDRIVQNQGIGLALLQEIIQACEALGYRQIMAAIGDSRNDGALKLHARAGYRTIGHAVRVGVKFGLWTDVVYVQRALGDPNAPPSVEDPIGYLTPSDQTEPSMIA
jgi:L-amino acid N-acyltransferase YncA